MPDSRPDPAIDSWSSFAVARVLATVVVAAAVPVVWMICIAPSATWQGRDAWLAAVLIVLSTLFWGTVAVWLIRGRFARPLAGALIAGLLSPVLCAALTVLLGVGLFPFELLFGAPGVTSWLGIFGLWSMWMMPGWYFPVGLAMGFVAWAIAGTVPPPNAGTGLTGPGLTIDFVCPCR